MMLQGHFCDSMLAEVHRDSGSWIYNTWLYFRGITAPVFFTVSGFIFTYLLFGQNHLGYKNPRIKKGIKRGLQLLLIGYLLRLDFIGLLIGEIYAAFFTTDVLHCIGLSLIAIAGLYYLTRNNFRLIFPWLMLSITILVFTLEPNYADLSYDGVPKFLSNYITKAHGSVFTIIPWIGYATFGAFMGYIFKLIQMNLVNQLKIITMLFISGTCLIFFLQIYFNYYR